MNPEMPIPLETVKATMNAYQKLVNRAEHIARLVCVGPDYSHWERVGSYYIRIGGGYSIDDTRATVMFIWEEMSGSRMRSHTESFPVRYLQMTDAEIVAIVSKEQV